ncbi:metallophosphoesterase family protein, partial [Methylomagnum sp.]
MRSEQQQNPIRILHLSDVHFATGKAWDSDPVLRALARHIGDEVQRGLVPDLVALTGDLAFSGKAGEYALALDWLSNRLWPVLPKGFPRERLLLVPGNHDVDRSAVGFVAKAIQKALLDQASQDDIAKLLADAGESETLLKRHAAYLDFLGQWHSGIHPFPWWQKTFDIRGTRLHIAGLDSAFLAHGDDDRSRLLIGRYQLHQAVLVPEAEQADWRLALLHHPWDYLAEWDGHEARAAVHLHCDLLLRGHLHFPQTERILPPDPARACLELAAGCVYENSRYPNAFQWIELYPAPRRVKLLFRTWLHGAWGVDRNIPGCPAGEAEYLLEGAKPGNPSPGPHAGGIPGGGHYQARLTGNGAIAQGPG